MAMKIEPFAKWSFTQTPRCVQFFFLGILGICLRKDFSHALILNDNPHLAKSSIVIRLLETGVAQDSRQVRLCYAMWWDCVLCL
jgi:hypothetical protein